MRTLLLIFLVLAVAGCQSDSQYESIETRKATLKRIAEKIKSSGNVQAAAKLEAEIITLDQFDQSSFDELANSLNQMGEHAEALEVLRLGSKANPENMQMKLHLAQAYIDNNEEISALELLTEYKGDKNVSYYNLLGLAHDGAGNSLAAKEAFEEGLKLDPNNKVLKNNLGLSYLFANDSKKAIEIFEELANFKDANAPTYRANLALSYGLSGQDKKAEAILQKDLKKKEVQENLKYYRELRKGNVKK